MKVPVEDRLAIQELVAQYAFHGDTRQYSEIADLFTTDAVFDETVVGLPLCEGRDALREFFPSLGTHIDYFMHINTNHRITAYDGTRASGTTHLHAVGHYLGNDMRIFGYYDDDYEKVDGEWLIRRRTLVEIAPTLGRIS